MYGNIKAGEREFFIFIFFDVGGVSFFSSSGPSILVFLKILSNVNTYLKRITKDITKTPEKARPEEEYGSPRAVALARNEIEIQFIDEFSRIQTDMERKRAELEMVIIVDPSVEKGSEESMRVEKLSGQLQSELNSLQVCG